MQDFLSKKSGTGFDDMTFLGQEEGSSLFLYFYFFPCNLIDLVVD